MFNQMISRSDAAALIPEEVSSQVIANVAQINPLMQLATRLQNMSRTMARMPVLSALANAYFVSGGNSLKKTTSVKWENKFVTAEEIACIVPISESTLEDTDYDIWSEVRPEIEKAFSVAISRAVLLGDNIPPSWTVDLGGAGIVAHAIAAGNRISIADYADLYEALLGENAALAPGLIGQLEADGFMSTGAIAALAMRGKLRNARNFDGDPLFKPSMQGATAYELDGSPIYFPTDGTMDSATAQIIAGQWPELVFAFRQDLTYKVLDQAVIQDAQGAIVYNLAQQDMVALRCVMRLGFALPNPINRVQQVEANRSPFAVAID